MIAYCPVDREKTDSWCEKAIFGLVLAVLVAGPLMVGGSRAWGFLPLQALTIAVAAVWALRLWISPQPKLLWPPVCWAVAAFVVYAVVRYCQADIEWVARKELLRVLVYAFLFFAILNNLHRQDYTHIIALTLVFLGMAISVYAIFQWVTKSHRIWGVSYADYPGRAGGTFIYPNHFAGFLEMIIPLGLCMVLMGRISHIAKILAGYAVLVMLAGVGVTFSRGGWLVTAAMLLLVCLVLLFQRDYRLKALVLLAVLLIAGAFLVPQAAVLQERARRMTENGGRVDDARFSIWWSAFRMWQDHPWWGMGPGYFDYRFSQYRLPDIQLHAGYAHNDYLNTLADWGLSGAVLVAAAFALLYWGILHCWKFVRGARDDFARKKSNKQAFMTGAAIGLAAILIHSMVDFTMQLPANAILAVTLMALLTSQWRFATERFWCSAGIITKCLATLMILGGAAELGFAEWHGAREWYFLHLADKTPPITFARIAALEKAFAADPGDFQTAYAIGECYKVKSFLSESDDPAGLARKAFTWYERSAALDPYDAYSWLRCGMCQDWIWSDSPGEKPDTSRYYQRANELDPNGYFTTANTGWHYMQTGDYAAARTWFERSGRLEWVVDRNEIGPDNLPLMDRLLEEAASAEPPGKRVPSAPVEK